MEITTVSASVHELDVEVPRSDRRDTKRFVVVRVRTDEGLEGHGIVRGSYWAHSIRALVDERIAPIVRGMDPVETGRIWERLRRELNPRVQTGVWSSAVSAVDVAAWDLKGRHLGEPIWRLLGGASGTVDTYTTFGLKRYSTDELVDVAREVVDGGVSRLKMKVAIEDATAPAADAERVTAVREAVGADVELMIDANYEFSIDRALALANRTAEAELSWFEEPVYANDSTLLDRLSRRTTVPIAAGQMEGHRLRHRDLIESGSVDVPQPNVCFVGGYSEAVRVAGLAASFDLDLAHAGGWPYQNMHLQAGVANGRLVEFHHGLWRDRLYEDPPYPDRGVLTLPTDPGLGLDLDDELLESTEIG